MPPVVLRNAADMYNSLTGGEDPVVSGITRVAQMLQTKQQRDEAKAQREFQNNLQTEAGQRAADAAQRQAQNDDWNQQQQAYALASKAAGLHHGKREKIPFEERAMLNQDAAQIPDTPEERKAWEEMAPTRLKTPETFTVRDHNGQEYQLPLLTASHLAEKQAEDSANKAKNDRDAGLAAGTSRKITPEMIATLKEVNPALAELFGNEGDVVPAADLRGVAGQLARPDPQPRALTHIDAGDRVIVQDAEGKTVQVIPKGKLPGVPLAEGELPPGKVRTLTGITNKFQADKVMEQARQGQTINSMADAVIASPGEATNQLAALYLLVKNLDPNSAVREGELNLAQATQSYWQTARNMWDRVDKGVVISPEAARDLAVATKKITKLWDGVAQGKAKQYQAQAGILGVGPQFNDYLKEFTVPGAQPAGAGAPLTKTQTNKRTGEKRTLISTDGGATWAPARQ